MEKIIFILTKINLFAANVHSKETNDYLKYNRLSKIYLECKANNIKKKALSFGKSIIKDTKYYQKKEWSDEKKKIEKTKEKVLNY